MGAEQSTPRLTEKQLAQIEEREKTNRLMGSLQNLDLNAHGHPHLTHSTLDKYSEAFSKDKKNLLAMNAIIANDPTDVLVNPSIAKRDDHVFNVKLDVEGAITNQKSSGRCWLFAGTNVLRLAVINKYKLKDDFELSQSYLFFYDKLEKANYFLENMIDLANEDINDRVVQYLFQAPVNDGGQYSMFVNIVNKYGVVPKNVYPESFASSSSSRVNWTVTAKLREYALQLRKAVQDGVSINSIRLLKQEMLEDIHRILVIFLGEPPKSFDWETYDKDGKFIHHKNLTPLKFYGDFVNFNVTNTLSLINDPRNDYSKLYTVDRLGNVVGGDPVLYVNTDVDTLKELVVKTLKSGKPVWFGCDVGKFRNNKLASLDMKGFDYELAFGVSFNMTKAERLLTGESLMTHAMVFTGVHVKDGKPTKYRVENSWGTGNPNGEGFWVMSDDWFSEYVYQIVLEKDDVPKRLVEVLDSEPYVLPAYDPMGALA
ncbi:unnamed protein product [Cunninghamella blakesleeana]